MHGKYRVGIVILIGISGILMLFPESPIHSLAAAYCQKMLADRFGCSIEHARLSIDPLRGTATISGLAVDTPADSNPKWSMKAERAFLRVQYGSFLRKRSIREIRIDHLEFKREELVPPVLPLPVQKGSKEEANTASPSNSKPKTGNPVRIDLLTIQNGSVQIVRIDPSGQKSNFEASEITISRTDVALDRSLPLLIAEIMGAD